MKFKILSMLVILGFLSVMPMIYMGKFDPLSSIESGLSTGVSEFKKLKVTAPENLSNAVSDINDTSYKKVQIYKWRDEHGVMQFGNTPPLTDAAAEQVVLRPGNTMQAVKVPEEKILKPEAEIESPNPYSVKGMKKVMDDARGVEELLQQRHEGQQQMLKDM